MFCMACVEAYLSPLYIFRGQRVVQWDVIRYLLHEPLEALAPMLLSGNKEQTIDWQIQVYSLQN